MKTMEAKILNKKNQHKINFNIKCLPEWANFIAMNANAEWRGYKKEPNIDHDNGSWFGHPSHLIRIMDRPTLFNGNWKDSLFEIEKTRQ